MFTHRVLRPFEGHTFDEDGKKIPYQYRAGELVDASEWRNPEGLVKTRYIAPLPPVVNETQEAARLRGRPRKDSAAV